MSCEHPLTAWRPVQGGPVKFNEQRDGRAYQKIELPCGECILCRLDQARQWAVRITHEAQLHEYNSFVTLTYNDEHLPMFGSLNYKGDMQRFWKRLRKQIGKLSYFAVGEYGDNTQRPHYHACIFGHAFTENRTVLRESPTMLWTNPQLENAWGLGNVSVGALTYQTAQYTASYVTKKLESKRRYTRVEPLTGELIDVEQPRAYMSLNPAIARGWLEKYGKQVYDHDRVIVNGQEMKPPKYYDQWLGKQDEKKLEKIKDKRRKQTKKMSPEQNRARARNAHARAKTRKKSI